MSPWTASGAGPAGDRAGRRLFPKLGKWTWRLIALGALALFAISPLGQVIAILSAVTVIGLPVYLILAAAPAVFLIALFIRLAAGALGNARKHAYVHASLCALAALLMIEVFVLRAHRENARLEARAAALAAGDIAQQSPISAGAVVATIRVSGYRGRGEDENACDDLCQRLLLNGFASRVLAVTLAPERGQRGRAKPSPEHALAPGLMGVMHWLERRDVCPPAQVRDNLRVLNVAQKARGQDSPQLRAASHAMRLRIAAGECLVSQPAALEAADAAFVYGQLARGRGSSGRGLDPFADTLSAWRVAWHRRSGDVWAPVFQTTAVRYLAFPGVLIPTYQHGAELRTWMGYQRIERRLGPYERGVADPPVAAMLSKLGVDVAIGDRASPDAARLVDEALASNAPLTQIQSRIVDDFLGRLSANRSWQIAVDDANRVAAIAADPRFAFTRAAQRAVDVVVSQQPQLAAQLAASLFARLDRLIAAGSATVVSKETRSATVHLSLALANLPDVVLQPYFDRIDALSRLPGLRAEAQKLLSRLNVYGAFAVPAIFRIMDDSLSERTPNANARWRQGYAAGLRALCLLGKEAAFARPLLEERIQRSGSAVRNTHDLLLMQTLLRMGAPADDLRALFAVDEAKENRLRSAINYASGSRACR